MSSSESISTASAWYDSYVMGHRPPDLHVSKSPAASVIDQGGGSWHLEIPTTAKRIYNLAQLDDHTAHSRDDFPWKPPLTLSLQARVSDEYLPGTWGFGFWNDPFGFLLGGDRTVRRIPTLPNAVWFFHASPENYLSFRDDLPACGFLAATFSSKVIHPAFLALASPALGFTLLPFTAGLVRGRMRQLIQQDAQQLTVPVTGWHSYFLSWEQSQAVFSVDGVEVLRTAVNPTLPLSLVIWIDNQYAAMPPRGRLNYGTLPNPSPAWLEIRNLKIEN
jgi:hypothetical protein